MPQNKTTRKPPVPPKPQVLDPIKARKVGENLMNARCKLLSEEPWYGTMAQQFQWKASAAVPTIGVMILTGGIVDCLFNPEWCETLKIEEMQGVLQHEIEHIVRLHLVRCGSRNPKLWNIATDMVINGLAANPNIINLPSGTPEKEGHYYPKDWAPNLSAEEVYSRLEKMRIVVHVSGGGQQILGDENSKDQMDIHGNTFDDHDVWAGNTASEDEARQVVKELVRQASVSAGDSPGHLKDAIKQLEKPAVSWRYEMRHAIGRQAGGKRGTWARQNRRRPSFGVKGKSTHAHVPLTVCVDTSGSMDIKRIQQAFAEIESCSAHFKITAVQFDHGYQCHSRYHRGDWRKIEIQGRGGTSFIALFTALEEKKLVGRMVVVITDGEASYPTPRKYPVLWVVIPHAVKGPNNTPPWGRSIYIEKSGL